ncbi:histone deacetylase [Myxococcota bacterium]|nr:histone deacetylase [Myxococcota bacterium]
MRACYSTGYTIPMPEGHRFPMGKFSMLHEILTEAGLLGAADVVEPTEASLKDLARVHDSAYLEALANDGLSRAEQRRLGLPVGPALFRRSRLAVQGTLLAGRMALDDGIAANLAGGTHHAFADHGEGFCVFNDVAVSIRCLREEELLRRCLVLDLDVHQGNGTARIFCDDPDTYTFSIHGQSNYPFQKEQSSLDVPLPNGIGDEGYLDALSHHLPTAIDQARPELVFYLAGVDPVRGDRFGKLDLSPEGLAQREQLVLSTLQETGLPCALLMSGGYARTPRQTAELHAVVHRKANQLFGPGRSLPHRHDPAAESRPTMGEPR